MKTPNPVLFGLASASYTLTALLALAPLASLYAAAPVVSNVRAAQRPGTHLVDIYYSV